MFKIAKEEVSIKPSELRVAIMEYLKRHHKIIDNVPHLDNNIRFTVNTKIFDIKDIDEIKILTRYEEGQ